VLTKNLGGSGLIRLRRAWSLSPLMRVGCLVILVLACTRSPLKACSCTESLTDPVAWLKKSGLVFSGEVVSVDTVSLPRVVYTEDADHNLVPSQYMDRVGIVTLRSIREWKGNGAKQYVVLAGAPAVTPLPRGTWLADCDVHLELGKRYLVFATEGYAEANRCAPTGDLDQRQQDVAALDAHARAKSRKAHGAKP
jgi:hypothetical protein